jgi:hypothetical protein
LTKAGIVVYNRFTCYFVTIISFKKELIYKKQIGGA